MVRLGKQKKQSDSTCSLDIRTRAWPTGFTCILALYFDWGPEVDFKEWVTAVALGEGEGDALFPYSEIALLTMAMIRLMSR